MAVNADYDIFRQAVTAVTERRIVVMIAFVLILFYIIFQLIVAVGGSVIIMAPFCPSRPG